MELTVVTDGFALGSGTAGYATRLVRELATRGHAVQVVGRGGPRHGAVIALERVPYADVWRPGGGWHADAMRAIGRRRWSLEVVRDWRAASTAGAILANSRMVADALWQRGFRSEVVRTGVDLERFRPTSEREDAVLFLGHGWRRKNFRGAVLATALLPGRPRLWVGGRDSRRVRRLAWARQILGDRLVDLGPVVDAADVVPKVTVVVHPTRYDPASNLVLEAMASGVPIVTTNRDGSGEILPRALVVPDPEDVGALGRALLFGREGGPSLGRALRETVEAWPDSRNARELEQLIQRGVEW